MTPNKFLDMLAFSVAWFNLSNLIIPCKELLFSIINNGILFGFPFMNDLCKVNIQRSHLVYR